MFFEIFFFLVYPFNHALLMCPRSSSFHCEALTSENMSKAILIRMLSNKSHQMMIKHVNFMLIWVFLSLMWFQQFFQFLPLPRCSSYFVPPQKQIEKHSHCNYGPLMTRKQLTCLNDVQKSQFMLTAVTLNRGFFIKFSAVNRSVWG